MYENIHEIPRMQMLQVIVDSLMNGEISEDEYKKLLAELNENG